MHVLVIYGLVGLVLSTLVAWGFAAWGEIADRKTTTSAKVTPSGGPIGYDANLAWSVAHAALPAKPLYSLVGHGQGVRAVVEATPKGRGTKTLRMAEYGWPVLMLRWHEIFDRGDGVPVELERGWFIDLPTPRFRAELTIVPSGVSIPRRLPLEPMWRGLAIGTAMYGSAVFVVVMMGKGLRMLVRKWRGRCPRCGYDLRGDLKSGCPECGWRREAKEEMLIVTQPSQEGR